MDGERRHSGDHADALSPRDQHTWVRDGESISQLSAFQSNIPNGADGFYDQAPVLDPITGEVQEPSSGDPFIRSLDSLAPSLAGLQSLDSSFDTLVKEDVEDRSSRIDHSVILTDTILPRETPMSNDSAVSNSSFEFLHSDDSPNKSGRTEAFFSPELQAELAETKTIVRDSEPVDSSGHPENGTELKNAVYGNSDVQPTHTIQHKHNIEGNAGPYIPETIKPFWDVPSQNTLAPADDLNGAFKPTVPVETPTVVMDIKDTSPLKRLEDKLEESRESAVEADAQGVFKPTVPVETPTVVRDAKDTSPLKSLEDKLEESRKNAVEAESEWQDITGGGSLLKKTVKKGQPETRPERGSVVTIKSSGKIENDFEHSAVIDVVDKNDELRFTVGDLEVINGLELAVQLMDVGEISEIKMEPRFAYGELGHQEIGIPSDATLTYTVELLKVEPAIEPENMTVQERVTVANGKVDKGNFWYFRKEAVIALSLYQRAISILEAPNDKFTTSEDVAQLNLAKARAYGNLSSAQVEERIWDEGLRSVNNALRYDPNNGKLWCRKIRIFREKGEFQQACDACEEVIQKGPLIGDTYLKKTRDELAVLKKKKRVSDDKEKAMYQRMLGGSSKQSNGSNRPSPPRDNVSGASNSTKKWLFFATAAAIAVCGVFIGVRYYQNSH